MTFCETPVSKCDQPADSSGSFESPRCDGGAAVLILLPIQVGISLFPAIRLFAVSQGRIERILQALASLNPVQVASPYRPTNSRMAWHVPFRRGDEVWIASRREQYDGN